MSLRVRLLLGAVAGLAASIIVMAAANATWRTVSPNGIQITVDNQNVALQETRDIKGTTQDGSLSLFALVGGAAAVVGPLLASTPRIGASAFLAASGLMIAANAAITRGVESVPDAWLAGNPADRIAFSAPTSAPLIAIAGGIGMIAAAVWLLTAARRAPRLTMPEGPPEGTGPGEPSGSDAGVWE